MNKITMYIARGFCGEKVAWTLNAEGLLTIFGEGAMENYFLPVIKSAPWYEYAEHIVEVRIAPGVKTIGHYAFCWLRNLTTVTLGNSVTTIGDEAFAHCPNLVSLSIPDSVTTIGLAVAYNCPNLVSVAIGDGVSSIADLAFDGCTSLTTVTLGNSVTTIGAFAFNECKEVTVSGLKGETSIGLHAFRGCHKFYTE